MIKQYTVAEEINRRLDFKQPQKSNLITLMAEQIQASILQEINGFSKEKSKEYAKEYLGDLSDEIIKALISGVCQLSQKAEKQIKDYEKVLTSIAKDEMYVIECVGYDCGDAWYESKINPDNPAKDILAKYQIFIKGNKNECVAALE